MTNVKIEKNKIILDGHQNDLETCETTTLLVKVLQESKDFEIVKSTSGYAEFKKTGNDNTYQFIAGYTYFKGLGLGYPVYIWKYVGGDVNNSNSYELLASDDIGTGNSNIQYSGGALLQGIFSLSTSSSTYTPLTNYVIGKSTTYQSDDITVYKDCFCFGRLFYLNSPAGGNFISKLVLSSATQNVKLGSNTITGVDTIKLIDATDNTKKDVFKLIGQE